MQQQMSTAGASSATAAGAAARGQQPTDHVFDFETPIDRSNTGEAGAAAAAAGGGLSLGEC